MYLIKKKPHMLGPALLRIRHMPTTPKYGGGLSNLKGSQSSARRLLKG